MRWIVWLGLVLLGCSDGGDEEPAEPRADASTRDDAGSDAGPAEDRCEVTIATPEQRGSEPKTDVWSYDAATRRLVTTVYAYDLDEEGRTLNVYGIHAGELVRYWTNHYDEHGRIERYEHYTSGSYVFANSYDGAGRLIAVERPEHGEGEPATKTTYRYDDASAPAIWTHSEIDVDVDGTLETVIDRMVEGQRTATVSIERRGMLHHALTFAYEGDRIDTIERDGGFWVSDAPDGTPNIRFQWTRDDEGNVTEYTQDGTDSFDNPFVNGEPDYLERYSPGCAPLLQQFPWLAHEPAPNSTGPRFRDEGD